MTWLKEFGRGAVLYWSGTRLFKREPELMLLGLVPGLVTALGFGVGLLALGWWGDNAAVAIARILVGDDSPWLVFMSFIVLFALIASALLIVIYAFVTVTSIVGQPFFERISHAVDDSLGPVPAGPGWPWWRNAVRGMGEAIRLGLVTVPLSVGLAAVGLIPVVGGVVSIVGGAVFGGWFLALEFTAFAFERRGLVLRHRREALARRRAYAIGFGAMAYVMSILAPLAVLMMPVAVVSGTTLARNILDGASAQAVTKPVN